MLFITCNSGDTSGSSYNAMRLYLSDELARLVAVAAVYSFSTRLAPVEHTSCAPDVITIRIVRAG